jgi:UDP-glucuronate decarboxylase
MMDTEDSFVGPVNIGNPGEYSMLELASAIIDISGSKSKIKYMALPKDDPKRRKPDIKLAMEKLNGWQPMVPLREGLEKTIHYFDKQLSRAEAKKYHLLFEQEKYA